MDILRLQFFGMDWTYTFHGMAMAMIYNYLPFAILPLYSALEKIPTSLIEAAQDLGATRRQIFTRVIWPMSRRSVGSISLFVFIPSLGEYLVPEVVGGARTYFLGSFLQTQFLVTRNWPLGSAAVTCLLLFSGVLLFMFRKGFNTDEEIRR
jgi:spermidine/putrescine transport system permease protein